MLILIEMLLVFHSINLSYYQLITPTLLHYHLLSLIITTIVNAQMFLFLFI